MDERWAYHFHRLGHLALASYKTDCRPRAQLAIDVGLDLQTPTELATAYPAAEPRASQSTLWRVQAELPLSRRQPLLVSPQCVKAFSE